MPQIPATVTVAAEGAALPPVAARLLADILAKGRTGWEGSPPEINTLVRLGRVVPLEDGIFYAKETYDLLARELLAYRLNTLHNLHYYLLLMAAMREAASGKNFLLRVKDVPAVLDGLRAWNDDEGNPLFGRLDLTRVGMSGHSFGAVTTQAVSGQSLPVGGSPLTEPRIKAAIAFSPSRPRRGRRGARIVSVRKIVIMGAAGRDFHNFNVVFRDRDDVRVTAFTATQIPDIAGRRYPAALAGPRYPDGIPVYGEERIEELAAAEGFDEAVFSYSDVSHQHVMEQASRIVALGADFRLLGAEAAMLRSRRPVVAVCAVRTGCGKSQTARKVAAIMKALGRRPVVVRHPMPYGDLAAQRVQRFATLEDMRRQRCTIEEMEEYEPHIEEGLTVFAGVDYAAILAAAEAEGDEALVDIEEAEDIPADDDETFLEEEEEEGGDVTNIIGGPVAEGEEEV